FIELHKLPHARALNDFGERVAAVLVDEAGSRDALAALAGSCATQQSFNDTCVNSFIQKFGRKVLRRPLSAAEAQAYKATFDRAATDRDGLKVLFAAFIQHPNFLFHIELGDTQTIREGRMKLTPFEVASRLSFQLIGTTPDDALLDAAAQGQLNSIEAVA